ncbi:DNA gyrase inhibitor YacG [Methylobacterium sp. J-068]|uniref:DNA gyrase inhibitor YacG n=1 Tax=Methylobacterium sp. J-068 TaxID=2836649 RepID=UPI001FBAD7EA|nr:DNA gyrase inhibitor YacG [Methylobacterium sp. J-068]MCJ2036339.1 DNA gyrase inhibitor YacG [Methylobacterium sp. J-068]
MPGRRRAPKAEPCPICRKPAEAAFTPFCSARCADIDLGRWLTDRYAIPTAEDEDEDAAGSGGLARDRD